MKNLLYFFPVLFLIASCSGVPDSSRVVNFSSEDTSYTNKVIPLELRLAATEALSYYPELSDTPIEFEFQENIVNSFMQAQPRISTIFNSRHKRAYVIKVTRRMEFNGKDIPIEQVPHDVLLGWLGHELGHIMDYTKKNSAGMIWLGFSYVTFDKAKMRAERRADIEALNHGLANEIIATKNFILNNSSLSLAYKSKIKKFYISPEQVLELVTELEEEVEEEMEEAREHNEVISSEPMPWLN